MDAADDPLGAELAEIQKLDDLAEAYGWGKDSKQYLQKLKLIQKAGLTAQRLGAGSGGGGEQAAAAASSSAAPSSGW